MNSLISVRLAVLVVLASCTAEPELFKPRRFCNQEQAGSVHVALLAAAPWQSYVDRMKPGLKLTPEEAVQDVVAASLFLEQKTLDATSFSQVFATPTVSQTEKETSTNTSVTDGQETTSKTAEEVAEISKEKKSGAAEDHAFGPSPQGARIAAGLPPGDVLKNRSPEVDPMLKYKVATALLQEVQMLNHYVSDAAQRKGLVPYLVRIQVALMPRTRHAPYDAYCNLSFFSGTRAGPSGTITRVTGGPAPSPNPVVVPLLVTDNLERALAGRAVNIVRQQSLALLAMIKGISSATEFQHFTDQFDAVLGQDMNSLLTLGRINDNTIRVRLGAQNEATSRYAMVPRTHDVTLLILLPQHDIQGEIRVMSRTVFVDAERGDELKARSIDMIRERLRRILTGGHAVFDSASKKFKFSNTSVELDENKAISLFFAAQTNDHGEFRRLLQDYPQQEQLWIELQDLVIGSQYQTLVFELPAPITPRLAHEPGRATGAASLRTVATMRDDERSTSIEIGGASGLRADLIEGTLAITAATNETLAGVVEAVAPTLRLRFPSLRRRGLLDGKREHKRGFGILTVTHNPAVKGERAVKWAIDQFFNDVPDAKVTEKPGKATKVTPALGYITRDASAKGGLTVHLTVAEPKVEQIEIVKRDVLLFLENATIPTLPAGLVWVDGSNPTRGLLLVGKDTRVEFRLADLNPKQQPKLIVKEKVVFRPLGAPDTQNETTVLAHDAITFEINQTGQ